MAASGRCSLSTPGGYIVRPRRRRRRADPSPHAPPGATHMQRTFATVAVVVALACAALAGTGCGSSKKTITETNAAGVVTTKTVPNVHFAKTKFVLHMGLAFGA